jgi:hypothetical protein
VRTEEDESCQSCHIRSTAQVTTEGWVPRSPHWLTCLPLLHSHSTEWWAQSQASRLVYNCWFSLSSYPAKNNEAPRATNLPAWRARQVFDELRGSAGPLLRHGVRARPFFDHAAAGRLREPLGVRAPAMARWAGTHRRSPPFRLCRRRSAPPRVPQDRGDGAAHGERQGQEPPAAEEGMFRCSISIWGSGPGP